MYPYQRQHVHTLIDRLAEPIQRLLVVTGPRQTGKTTIVKQALELSRPEHAYRYVALDEPVPPEPAAAPILDDTASRIDHEKRDAKWLTSLWERARRAADSSDIGLVLVLDEIQKLDGWSEVVKGLWDADRAAGRRLHVVLLGSAPLLMQQGLTETLAGRFELVRVTHWSFPEMYQAFGLDLSRYLYFGGYPGSMGLVKNEPRWRAYVLDSLIEPNIYRDILMMTRVDKPALLRQLFELGCAFSGQILSLNKMVGQLQNAGNETTLAHYLDLLTKAGLLAGLQKFAGREHRRRASPPKLVVLNTALMTTHAGYTFEQASADRTFWGRLVESAVGAHFYNAGSPDVRLYYWRKSPYEVDYVVEKGRRIVAIEVKSGPGNEKPRGLEAFQREFKSCHTLVIGQNGMPLDTFLSSVPDDWFDLS